MGGFLLSVTGREKEVAEFKEHLVAGKQGKFTVPGGMAGQNLS